MTTKTPFKVGISLHSFAKEFVHFKWSFDDMMHKASLLGGGVEIVGPTHQRGFPELTPEFERMFKSAVERYGLTPTSYGSYADPFMLPDRNLTPDELYEYTVPQIKGAAKLGFPVVRLQYFTAVTIEKLIPVAEKYNVKMGYELHTPMMIEAPKTQELVAQIRRIGSEALGLIPDCGIFARSVSKKHIARVRQAGVAEQAIQRALGLWAEKKLEEEIVEIMRSEGVDEKTLAPLGSLLGSFGFSEPSALADIKEHIIHMHGKFFEMVDGEEPDIRYEEVVKALLDIGYTGWISSEYEGMPADNVFEVVQEQQEMIKKYIRKYAG